MLARIRSRLTYANVMASIAVFAALGLGTAWALEANSVKSKHIVNGQVKPEDLGIPAKFKSAELPDAFGGCPGVGNGFHDLSPDVNNEVGYYRDPAGIVSLRGLAVQCNTPQYDVLTLPAGYRPAKQVIAYIGVSGYITIGNNGNVETQSLLSGNSWLPLDNLSFRCGPSGEDGCP